MDPLVANAIHDAKNLLAVLVGDLAEVSREYRHKTGEPGLPALRRAGQLAERLNTQLVELLALYRAGEGSLRLAIDDHDLADFLDEIVAESAWETMGEEAKTLEADFSAAAKLGVWAFDAYQVRFVLTDALRNARRYARSRIRFSVGSEAGGGVRFTVEDDGPGFGESGDGREGNGGGESSEGEMADVMVMRPSGSGLGLQFARIIAHHHATPGGHCGRVEMANDGLGVGGARLSLILP